MDIGPKTIKVFEEALKNAKTVVWNGPMGVFEIEDFAGGTKAVAEMIAKIKGTTVIGGEILRQLLPNSVWNQLIRMSRQEEEHHSNFLKERISQV